MAYVSPTLLVTTLNAGGYNTPRKRQRLKDWIKKSNLILCCLQEAHYMFRYSNTFKVKIQIV